MPPARQPAAGLTDTWGRANRRLEDKICPACGATFHPLRAASRFCSRPCMWSKNGGHNRKPETVWINAKGYEEGRVWVDGEHVAFKRHRRIMEEYLGRRLLPGEDVHHIDGDKLNNEIGNLQVISHGEHSRLHSSQRTYARGYRLNLTDAERSARAERMRIMRRADVARARGDAS